MRSLLLATFLLLAVLQFTGVGALMPLPWGEPSRGLQTLIECPGDQFKIGDPIKIHYKKRNVSDKPVVVWSSGFWPNHRIRVCDRFGAAVARTEQGELRYKAFAPGGGRDKNFPTTIAPGQEDDTASAQNLAELYDLKKPGTYSLQYLYEEYQTGWQGQAWSNVLVIEILPDGKEPTPREKPTLK